MSKLERYLPLMQTKAGITFARDLLDVNGQVLMTQGTTLSAASINTLHRRDITALWVLVPQMHSTDLQTQETALRQHHRERLARLFRHISDKADDRYLLAIVTRHRKIKSS